MQNILDSKQNILKEYEGKYKIESVNSDGCCSYVYKLSDQKTDQTKFLKISSPSPEENFGEMEGMLKNRFHDVGIVQDGINYFLEIHSKGTIEDKDAIKTFEKGGVYGVYIPKVYENGQKNGISYVLMENIDDNITLKEAIETKKVDIKKYGKLVANSEKLINNFHNFIIKQYNNYLKNKDYRFYKKEEEDNKTEAVHRKKIFEIYKSIENLEQKYKIIDTTTIENFNKAFSKYEELLNNYSNRYDKILKENSNNEFIKKNNPEKMGNLLAEIKKYQEDIIENAKFLSTREQHFHHPDIHWDNILYDKKKDRYVLIDFDNIGKDIYMNSLIPRLTGLQEKEDVMKKTFSYIENGGLADIDDIQNMSNARLIRSLVQPLYSGLIFMENAIKGKTEEIKENPGDKLKSVEKALKLKEKLSNTKEEFQKEFKHSKLFLEDRGIFLQKKYGKRILNNLRNKTAERYKNQNPNDYNICIGKVGSEEISKFNELLKSLDKNSIFLEIQKDENPPYIEFLNNLEKKIKELPEINEKNINILLPSGTDLGQTKKGGDNKELYKVNLDGESGLIGLRPKEYAKFLSQIMNLLKSKCKNCTLNFHTISCGSDSISATTNKSLIEANAEMVLRPKLEEEIKDLKTALKEKEGKLEKLKQDLEEQFPNSQEIKQGYIEKVKSKKELSEDELKFKKIDDDFIKLKQEVVREKQKIEQKEEKIDKIINKKVEYKQPEQTLIDKIWNEFKEIEDFEKNSENFKNVNIIGVDGNHVYNMSIADSWYHSKKESNKWCITDYLINSVNNFTIGGTTIWNGVEQDEYKYNVGLVEEELVNQINKELITLKKKGTHVGDQIEKDRYRFDSKEPLQFKTGQTKVKNVFSLKKTNLLEELD